VDTNRVYVAGMSHGAMMASTLACLMSDRIAAIAPVAGVRHPDGCTPTRPVPIITFHGTDDPYIGYEGGFGAKALELPAPGGKSGTIGDAAAADPSLVDPADAAAIPDRVAAWAEQNGCTAGDTLPDIGDVTPQQWACTDRGDVTFYTVHGGGHSWPGSAFDAGIAQFVGPTTTSIDATALMVAFFAQHPLGGSE
jgi:polyhydroxybutyrate depolymerase